MDGYCDITCDNPFINLVRSAGLRWQEWFGWRLFQVRLRLAYGDLAYGVDVFCRSSTHDVLASGVEERRLLVSVG